MILAGNPVVRVDFDPVNPANVVATTTPVATAPILSGYMSLSPSGRFLVRRDFNPPAISLVEVATGVVSPWSNLPNASIAVSPNSWR